ncbi:hypothetical protein MIR68_003881 [Amoeboaphelidium protococcarum]|nr:hypothetical protein MIR68_003881 [Amoeboaphelidium protococcarum]
MEFKKELANQFQDLIAQHHGKLQSDVLVQLCYMIKRDLLQLNNQHTKELLRFSGWELFRLICSSTHQQAIMSAVDVDLLRDIIQLCYEYTSKKEFLIACMEVLHYSSNQQFLNDALFKQILELTVQCVEQLPAKPQVRSLMELLELLGTLNGLQQSFMFQMLYRIFTIAAQNSLVEFQNLIVHFVNVIEEFVEECLVLDQCDQVDLYQDILHKIDQIIAVLDINTSQLVERVQEGNQRAVGFIITRLVVLKRLKLQSDDPLCMEVYYPCMMSCLQVSQDTPSDQWMTFMNSVLDCSIELLNKQADYSLCIIPDLDCLHGQIHFMSQCPNPQLRHQCFQQFPILCNKLSKEHLLVMLKLLLTDCPYENFKVVSLQLVKQEFSNAFKCPNCFLSDETRDIIKMLTPPSNSENVSWHIQFLNFNRWLLLTDREMVLYDSVLDRYLEKFYLNPLKKDVSDKKWTHEPLLEYNLKMLQDLRSDVFG